MKGFTLIELIISIAIFAAMTALVIARYGSFNQGTLLTNIAYDMALTIRTAQTYGLSVKSADASTDNFNAAYGIDFAGNDTTHFTFFADISNSGSNANRYDGIGSGEAITTYAITQGAKITQICLATTIDNCTGSNVLGPNDILDVTYKRPNPNAIFTVTSNGTPGLNTQPIAFITLTSADNSHSEVVYIRKNGQISVGN
ncbi:MAG TPA: prepilin-type N-terminal cleavage/methylation domain-containing protein [Candidatus Paceibacterota bacterium]|jgi:prepilin-type N-terminal cleavage/methylation domain-containing protein|nr:prepilin-type N-terminal cleavage/methylation domain-containing protein [Candidatus Paceibacterota bacterium]